MISIIWSAALGDDEDFSSPIARRETLMPEWAGCSGNEDATVNDIVENWLDRETFEEHFDGYGEGVDLRVRIHSPEAIAGDFEVEVRHVLKAQARRIER